MSGYTGLTVILIGLAAIITGGVFSAIPGYLPSTLANGYTLFGEVGTSVAAIGVLFIFGGLFVLAADA